MMNLYFHGGKCCGIKTIAGFTWGKPDTWDIMPEQGKTAARNADANGYNVSTTKPFFTGEAPRETYEERLERLISWCKERRPQGAIEVVLAGNKSGTYNQWDYWEPILFGHGFKPSCEQFVNSNSTRGIRIYHLVYDETKVKKVPEVSNPFGRS